MDCWRPVVPQRTMAIGVAASMPWPTSISAIWPMRSVPIMMTLVPGVLATCAQSMLESSLAGSSWPVTSVSREQKSRCVSGTPA